MSLARPCERLQERKGLWGKTYDAVIQSYHTFIHSAYLMYISYVLNREKHPSRT